MHQAGINGPMSGRFSGRPGPPLARCDTFPETHRLRHRDLRQRPQHNSRTVAADLDKTAAEIRNPAARYTAEALEKAGHPEAAERLYYILKEIAADPDEVPVSQESLAHLAGFIATTTLPHGAIISIGPDGNATIEWHFTGPPEHGVQSWNPRHPDTPGRDHPSLRNLSPSHRTQPDSGIGPIQQTRPGNKSRRASPANDPSGPLGRLAGPSNRHGEPVLTHLVGVGQLVGDRLDDVDTQPAIRTAIDTRFNVRLRRLNSRVKTQPVIQEINSHR